MITLQQLRYFIATAKYKSFSRAAEALFLSQPALSKQISLLERSLQFVLLERTPHGVSVTEKGKQFLQRVQPLVQELDTVLGETTEPAQLRIGVLPSIASYYLPTVINQFGSARLTTIIKNTSGELLEMVHTGELDAAIVQDRTHFDGLKHLFLFEEPYLVALPRIHPFAKKEALQIKDLHQEKLILHHAPCDIRDSLDAAFDEHGIEPVVSMEAALNDSLLSYTASGMGLSFLPAMMAANVSHKNIVYKRMQGDPICREIHLFARTQSILDPLLPLSLRPCSPHTID